MKNVQTANKARGSFIIRAGFLSLWNNPWKMPLVAFSDSLLRAE